MSRLGEGLSRLFGRVEILARGAESNLRAAEQALARGYALEARAHARALLARVPRSPLGLGLWADAAEACWFYDEVVEALDKLVVQVPWRHDVWLRLGRAGVEAGSPHARRALERAASGREDLAIAREALMLLADLDLAAGEPARAQRWLERIPLASGDAELALRRGECAAALGRWDEAREWRDRSDGLDEDDREALGGRWRLLQARVARRFPAEARGASPLMLALGAFLLDAVGAEVELGQLVASSDDAAQVGRAREVLHDLGVAGEPRWQAAFALAEGRRGDAARALLDAAEHGDGGAAEALALLAVEWRDLAALASMADKHPEALPADAKLLREGQAALAAGHDGRALELFEAAWALGGGAQGWARALLTELCAAWLPADGAARWEHVLAELREGARELGLPELATPIEALARERDRPLYVAILGEFNAGKSTFINALLGTDVAPTGVLPTTASLHWVAWAPDPIARVLVRGGTDRLVPHDELKATLDEVRQSGARLDRVFIYAPIERLKRIEILDTPGFNAPDTTHAEEARRAIEEAHVALWLLDATTPLKESERKVIEEVGKAGVPIQVLVNKRDRLKEPDLERVMAYLRQALIETHIDSLAPPVAFSAQLALAGRLGNAQALEASGWAEVETLLAERIVDVADRLRERALRRKASRIAAALAEAAEAHAATEHDKSEAGLARQTAARAAAANLRANRAAIAERMLGRLTEPLSALRADVAPIEQLPEERRGDAEVRSYILDKTLERLTPPICAGVVELAPKAELAARALEAPVRAVLSGAVAASSEKIGQPVLEAALEACAEAYERHAGSAAPPNAHRVASLRLGALRDALKELGTRN